MIKISIAALYSQQLKYNSTLFCRYNQNLQYIWLVAKQIIFKEDEEKTSDFNFDAFVSYHNSDFWWLKDELLKHLGNREIETTVANYLNDCQGHGTGERYPKYRFCVDHWHFQVGRPVTDNIVEAIISSRSIIMFVSKKFIKSFWCQFEVNLAHVHCLSHRRQKIIAVVHPEILNLRHKSIPLTLDALLDTVTYIEWPLNVDSRPLFWLRLSTALGTPIGILNLRDETPL